MPIEDKIRSVGNKGITYPWLRRFIVVGPYNKHYRRDAAASILGEAFVSAAHRARRLRSRAARKTG
jgi:hypothetical protein